MFPKNRLSDGSGSCCLLLVALRAFDFSWLQQYSILLARVLLTNAPHPPRLMRPLFPCLFLLLLPTATTKVTSLDDWIGEIDVKPSAWHSATSKRFRSLTERLSRPGSLCLETLYLTTLLQQLQFYLISSITCAESATIHNCIPLIKS